MPELPEVETVVRYLKNKIINQTINKINMIYSPVLKNSNLEEFNNYLINEKFENIINYLLFYEIIKKIVGFTNFVLLKI